MIDNDINKVFTWLKKQVKRKPNIYKESNFTLKNYIDYWYNEEYGLCKTPDVLRDYINDNCIGWKFLDPKKIRFSLALHDVMRKGNKNQVYKQGNFQVTVIGNCECCGIKNVKFFIVTHREGTGDGYPVYWLLCSI